MKKWLAPLASLCALIFAATAVAQWQVCDHCVPIGNGVGTGFAGVAPGTTGRPLVSNGASSDPSFAVLGPTGGGTGSTPAYGTICNPTNATATAIACQNGVLHSKDMGAVGDNSTNDTTALQSWLDACQSANLTCYLDQGFYKTTGALSITDASCITIVGGGSNFSVINLSSTTTNAITINTDGFCLLRDFGVWGSASASAGSLIDVTGPSNGNTNSVFENLRLLQGWDGLRFHAAQGWRVVGNHFDIQNNTNLYVENTVSPGGGDVVIQGNSFVGNTSATNIYHRSTGGLKIVGNKLVSGLHGYWLDLPNAAAGADVILSGNSLEGHTTDAIRANHTGTATMFNLTIAGNQIDANIAINLLDTTASWLQHVTITGNTIQQSSGRNAVVISGASTFNVSSNTFLSHGGTATAVTIGANAAKGVIGPNQYSDYTTNVANSSTTTTEVGQSIGYNSVSALAQATTSYIGSSGTNGNEANVQALCTRPMSFKYLYVQSAAPAGGQTITNTFRINNADTALTCTITGAATTCNDTSHVVACTAGQTYSVKAVTSATTGSIGNYSAGVMAQ